MAFHGNCGKIFSTLIDTEISYQCIKLLKEFSFKNHIESNIKLFTTKKEENFHQYDAIITAKEKIIKKFHKNNDYFVVKLSFDDFISLCSTREQQNLIKEIPKNHIMEFIRKNFIIIVNQNYVTQLTDILQGFTILKSHNNQHANLLMIEGKTFGVTNHFECINHPLLFEVLQFPEKKIIFYLIIKKENEKFWSFLQEKTEWFSK